LALSQGALTEPPGQNALELYRAVLARDPANDLARRGIDSVADELIVQAERALMEQDMTRLASAVDAVRSVRPDHPRLEFFVSQLEHGRTQQGKSGQPVRAVDTMGRPLETAARSNELPSVRVQAFVQLANDRMRSNQLIGKDSAQSYLVSARKIDATDPAVVQSVATLAAQLQANQQKAVRENRLDDASRWLQNAIELDVDRVQIATMRADIDSARIGNIRADNGKLLVLANQRIAQGRLIEPKSDSALHYLDLLRAADPDFEGFGETSALLASRALTESRTALGAGNIDRADQYARAAADAGAPAAEVADLNAKIMSARVVRPAAVDAAQEPSVLPENKLRRTFFIAPSYPSRARERGTEGWVDLEFTVTKDGTTRDRSCGRRNRRKHSTVLQPTRSGAGAMSRASSMAQSSSSASRRACASGSPSNLQKGTLPDFPKDRRKSGSAPSHGFFVATARSCARPSRYATTAQAAATPLPPARCRRRSSTRSR
jgi:hypothetical protein